MIGFFKRMIFLPYGIKLRLCDNSYHMLCNIWTNNTSTTNLYLKKQNISKDFIYNTFTESEISTVSIKEDNIKRRNNYKFRN